MVEAESVGEEVRGKDLEVGGVIAGQGKAAALRHKDRGDGVEAGVA